MAEKRGRKIQGYLFTILLLILLVLGVALLLPVYRAQQKKQAELIQLRTQLDNKRAERNTRVQQTEALKTSPAAVEKVAREKFRYAREGETLLQYPVPPEKQRKGE